MAFCHRLPFRYPNLYHVRVFFFYEAWADLNSGILGMVLLPHHNAFRRDIMTPVWGAANKGTIALWPLATVVQFGAGR